MQENNYRITFSNQRTDATKSVDIYAENSDKAFAIAYQMSEARNGKYTDIGVEPIPVGPTVIGVKFRYLDTVFKKRFLGYVFIRANNEADAVAYYNKYYKGKRFWFNAGKTVEDGKCVREEVIQTYFASCPGFDADATVKEAV